MLYRLLTIVLLISLPIFAIAQANFKIGIETTNTLFFTALDQSNEILQSKPLLRYAAGIFVRQRLKKSSNKYNYLKTARKDGLYLDYGVNFVAGGYQYKVGTIETHKDQLLVEFPLLLVLKYKRIFWMSNAWKRKGMGSFVRMGIKPSYQPPQNFTASQSMNNETIIETTQYGGWNIGYSLGSGLTQPLKNGDNIALGWSFNFNLLPTTFITFKHTQSNVSQSINLKPFSFYFGLNVLYLFNGKRFGKGVMPPVIYSPRT